MSNPQQPQSIPFRQWLDSLRGVQPEEPSEERQALIDAQAREWGGE